MPLNSDCYRDADTGAETAAGCGETERPVHHPPAGIHTWHVLNMYITHQQVYLARA
jgi:hypothetical protein